MHPLSLPQSNTILKFTKKHDNSNLQFGVVGCLFYCMSLMSQKNYFLSEFLP